MILEIPTNPSHSMTDFITCARCPQAKLFHILDIMKLKSILVWFFSVESFYSADIHN